MAFHRIATLLTAVALAACLDPTSERTRRDLEETGVAQLAGVRARIEPGVALAVDQAGAFVRFRANAPELAVSLANATTEERRISVELVNTFAGSTVSVPATTTATGGLAFEVVVPAGGETSATVELPVAKVPARFGFAWVGDVQGGNLRFTRVRARINADPSFDFVLFAGDVTQQGSWPRPICCCDRGSRCSATTNPCPASPWRSSAPSAASTCASTTRARASCSSTAPPAPSTPRPSTSCARRWMRPAPRCAWWPCTSRPSIPRACATAASTTAAGTVEVEPVLVP